MERSELLVLGHPDEHDDDPGDGVHVVMVPPVGAVHAPGLGLPELQILLELLVAVLLDGVAALAAAEAVLAGVQLSKVNGEGCVGPVEAGGVGGRTDDLDADDSVAMVVKDLERA